MFQKKIKELIKSEIIFNKYFNPIMRNVVKILNINIPDAKAHFMPVIGTLCYQLSEGKKIYFTSNGYDSIANIIYWKGLAGFEGETINLFLKLAKNSKVIFDIGANTGIYALLSAIYYPRQKTYAFEPLPRVFKYLKKNKAINHVDNLSIFSYAVSNFNGRIKLFIPDSPMPSSASTLEGFRETSEAISVKAITLDSFKEKQKICKINLIKIDTEATEDLVFQGSKKILKIDRPLIICEVLKGRTEQKLQAILTKYHYKYFLITDKGLIKKNRIEGDSTYLYKNFLFVPSEKTNQVILLSQEPDLII